MTCSVCSATNESGAAFCYRCGTSLTSSPPAATGPTVSLNRGASRSFRSTAATLPRAEEAYAQVFDPPSMSNSGIQPFRVPSEPRYSPPGQYGVGTAASGTISTMALIALLLGIVSFFGPFFFFSIPAIILGSIAHREIEASDGRVTGDGLAKAAMILGSINIAVSVFILYIFLIIF